MSADSYTQVQQSSYREEMPSWHPSEALQEGLHRLNHDISYSRSLTTCPGQTEHLEALIKSLAQGLATAKPKRTDVNIEGILLMLRANRAHVLHTSTTNTSLIEG
jgi:hypothetical protein